MGQGSTSAEVAQAPGKQRSRPARSLFYIVMGFVALFAAFAGFAKTFFWPVATAAFHAPPFVFLHGACAFSWVLIFAAQPWLIRERMHARHRQLGYVGVAAAIGFTSTAPFVAAFAAARDFANGGGETAISSVVGTFTSTLIFISVVGFGVLLRKDAASHKRLMVLATIAVLWPAWFRFRHYFPGIPNPELTIADVVTDGLIVIAAMRDQVVEGRIHRVWLIGGSFLIIEHVLEAVYFDSPGWRALAHALYAPFAP